jgi:tRNA A37 threonylcarbamoyladenosine modification protein TsaB
VTAPCRPGEVYGKIYECHPEYLAVVQTEWIGTPQLMADAAGAEAIARDLNAPLVLAGESSHIIGRVLDERRESYLTVPLAMEAVVIEIGIAGAGALQNGETADPLELQPLYLAPSAAERNLQNAV